MKRNPALLLVGVVLVVIGTWRLGAFIDQRLVEKNMVSTTTEQSMFRPPEPRTGFPTNTAEAMGPRQWYVAYARDADPGSWKEVEDPAVTTLWAREVLFRESLNHPPRLAELVVSDISLGQFEGPSCICQDIR